MSPPAYVYYPFSTSHSIRILSLEPGGYSAPLVAGLITTALHNLQHNDSRSSGADFEAVSYAWGADRAASKDLILQNPGQATNIKIRDNVDTMLRYLRLEQETRYLWIDALCINQADQKEKEEQVQFMGEIYKRAKNVVVWVGQPDPATETDGTIEQMFSHLEKYADARNEPKRERTWFKLRPFLEREWFDRRWVIQEAILAEHATLQCGRRNMSFELFARQTWKIAQYQQRFKSRIWSVVRKLWTIYKLRRAEARPDVLNLLVEFSTARCQNDLDRLYALNALTETRVREVSYKISVEKLYSEYAAFHISSGSLAILACSGAFRDTDSALPSWIPDWRAAPKYRPITTQSTPRQTYKKTLNQIAAIAQIVDSGHSLRLMCTKLGHVKQVANPAPMPVWDSQLLGILLEWFHSFESNGTGFSLHRRQKGRDIDQVDFLSCLSLGTISKRSNVLSPDHPWNQDTHDEDTPGISATLAHLIHEARRDDLQDPHDAAKIPQGFKDILKHLTYGNFGSQSDVRFDATSILMTDDNPLAYEGPMARRITPTEFIEILCRTIAGRTCFWTKDGTFGLGPGEMAVGDLVVSVPGCSTPYVLRVVGEEPSVGSRLFSRKAWSHDAPDTKHFTVVGDCYVHAFTMEEDIDEESLRPYHII